MSDRLRSIIHSPACGTTSPLSGTERASIAVGSRLSPTPASRCCGLPHRVAEPRVRSAPRSRDHGR